MRSLRVRLAALVTAISLGVLSVAGAAVVWIVDQQMHDSVRDEAQRALRNAVASQAIGAEGTVASRSPGEPIVTVRSMPGPGAGTGRITEKLHHDLPMLDRLESLEPGELLVDRQEVDGSPAYVAATVTVDDQGRRNVLAAVASLTETERTLAAMRAATVLTVPAFAVLLGAVAASAAGRVLRPVATMRTEAEAISHGTLHQRLTPPSTRELADLAATMNDMLERLDRAATNHHRFLSDVSHELRSPLATIRGTVELAANNPASLASAAPTALAEIDRLDHLVSGLLHLSRLDEPGRIELCEIDLDDVVTTHARVIRRSGVQIETRDVRHARLYGDQRSIDALVRNLLTNAVRHAQDQVMISVEHRRSTVEMIVDDDGNGIPPEHREMVFERFTRLDEGRSREVGGTGLGLAVAAAAAHAHGGFITIEEAPIGGARFRVRLPTSPTTASTVPSETS